MLIGNGSSVSSMHSWQFSEYGTWTDGNNVEDLLFRQELADQSGSTFGDPGPFQDSAIYIELVEFCNDHVNMFEYYTIWHSIIILSNIGNIE